MCRAVEEIREMAPGLVPQQENGPPWLYSGIVSMHATVEYFPVHEFAAAPSQGTIGIIFISTAGSARGWLRQNFRQDEDSCRSTGVAEGGISESLVIHFGHRWREGWVAKTGAIRCDLKTS